MAPSANPGRFQYTGQMYLHEIGLSYYKARMYSPVLGRFMQTDPIGYGDGPNWYAYTHNDPVNWTDPTGLITELPPTPDPFNPGRPTPPVDDCVAHPENCIVIQAQRYDWTLEHRQWQIAQLTWGTDPWTASRLPTMFNVGKTLWDGTIANPCIGRTIKRDGLALALDLASLVPGDEETGPTVKMALSAASYAASGDLTGRASAATAGGAEAAHAATQSSGSGAARMGGRIAGGLGAAAGVIGGANDVKNTVNDYNQCSAEQRH